MSATNNSFVLVTIITVLNVMQEVIDSLILVYMSFTSSSSVISKLCKWINCACSWYPGLEAMIICSLCVLIVTTYEESSLSFLSLGSIFWGNYMYDGWIHLQVAPPPCNASHHGLCQWLTPSIFFFATVALWTLVFQNCPNTFIWWFVTLVDPYIRVW